MAVPWTKNTRLETYLLPYILCPQRTIFVEQMGGVATYDATKRAPVYSWRQQTIEGIETDISTNHVDTQTFPAQHRIQYH